MNDQKLFSDGEMKETSSHQPQFVKIIITEFFQKISIPIAFNRYLVGEKSDIAVLKSPLGKSWHVKVRGHINGVFFEEGWEDFVEDHGLCSGDILVFRFEGNMVFHVTIFDETACEKNYSPLVLKGVEKMECQRERKVEEHVEASKGGLKVGFEGRNSYRPKAPYFLATIKTCNLDRNYMKFVVANSLGNRNNITLIDPERRWIAATIYHRKSPHNRTCLFGGWRRFTVINKLVEGDECFFELVAKDVMNVRISRRAILNNSMSSLST
ncbi:putative B3 domain-containing protein Os04g0347400 isoform X2 [Tasmannia lanceolata]|uniref:putative B3 domain-containing protein Os04g0347400 isoform X2 n=1 Tax=Tasmannia lanceolata TaxID=3420 RepID=UPI00406408DA